MGPKEPRSTVLTPEEEAIVVAFRRHTLLPLDDCLYGLQPTIPHLTRSSLHRCLERHGISRLPEIEGDKPKTKRFAAYADRLLPHRHRRGQDGRGQALPVRRDRPNLEVRLRQAARRKPTRYTALGLPARPDRGRALQDPHRADRQRQAVLPRAAQPLRPDRARYSVHMLRPGLPRERHRAPPDKAATIRGPTARSSG